MFVWTVFQSWRVGMLLLRRDLDILHQKTLASADWSESDRPVDPVSEARALGNFGTT